MASPTAQSRLRGHRIYQDGEQWRFADTDEPTTETWKDKPCGQCGRHNTPQGHDACLGELPGVVNACCGHGDTSEAYIEFVDGTIFRGFSVMTSNICTYCGTPRKPIGMDICLMKTTDTKAPECKIHYAACGSCGYEPVEFKGEWDEHKWSPVFGYILWAWMVFLMGFAAGGYLTSLYQEVPQ